MLQRFKNKDVFSLSDQRHIAPLVVLRMAFGLVMLISTIRFMAKGWINAFYVKPSFHFTFYGLEWIKPLPPSWMYLLFLVMATAALCMVLGLFYRVFSFTFLFCFIYIELIDKSYYLNHYYFVSLIAFLLVLVPAHRYFSLDVLRKPALKATHVPAWTINIFKWQLMIVYICAGLSKLTHDWLLEALPLRLWLPAENNIPLVGSLLAQTWVAYLFSWFGAVFDLSISFLLLNEKTRRPAYALVLLFHILTALLFKIGMFPYIMISTTLIFFSEGFHLKLIGLLRKGLGPKNYQKAQQGKVSVIYASRRNRYIFFLLGFYFLLQLLLPFRYLLYPGSLLWTEEGYRFSWRVMLMEKGGTAFFYIKDAKTGRRWEVINSDLLTPLQERMMETQPDMILQFAHHIHDVYEKKGIKDPAVSVESYVTLNGSGSRLYIDSTVDLAKQKENFLPKKWILPFNRPRNKN